MRRARHCPVTLARMLGRMLGLALGLALAASLALARPAAAQRAPDDGDADMSPQAGRALLIGASVHAGLFRCSQEACGLGTFAAGFDVHMGRMLTRSLGLVIDGWVLGHPAEGAGVVDTMVTLGPRVWFGPKLWLWGGVGLGHSCIESAAGEACELGLGLAAGIGYELAAADFFALDLLLRAGDVLESDTSGPTATALSAGLGFTWF